MLWAAAGVPSGTAPGYLWTWGWTFRGTVGNNSVTPNISSPIQIGTDLWTDVSNHHFTSHAIRADGTLWGWGEGTTGDVGDGNALNRSSPVQLGSDTDWASLSRGNSNSDMLALKTDGSLWGWGNNQYGGALGLGDLVSRSNPTQVGALTDWGPITMGYRNSISVKTDGTLWNWGMASNGALGNNTITPHISSPVQLGSDTDWLMASGGERNVMALKTDGTLWGWGTNTNGQIGIGTAVSISSPVQVGSLTDWAFVDTATGSFTAALKTDGTLWTWGFNSKGQLGDGTILSRSSPVQVGSLTDWVRIEVGDNFMLAEKADETLWVWGNGAYGQLGNSTIINRSSPVQLAADVNWTEFSAGSGVVLSIKS